MWGLPRGVWKLGLGRVVASKYFAVIFDAIEGLAGKEVFLVPLCQVVNARLVA